MRLLVFSAGFSRVLLVCILNYLVNWKSCCMFFFVFLFVIFWVSSLYCVPFLFYSVCEFVWKGTFDLLEERNLKDHHFSVMSEPQLLMPNYVYSLIMWASNDDLWQILLTLEWWGLVLRWWRGQYKTKMLFCLVLFILPKFTIVRTWCKYFNNKNTWFIVNIIISICWDVNW